ncbi:MAG: hypothetical protein AB1505_17645 [Candidatus Latescibacterota bacterium]
MTRILRSALLVAVVLAATPARAQEPLVQPGPSDALSVGPLSLVLGSMGGSYEHLVSERVGLVLEGGYAFSREYSLAAGLRRHYSSAPDREPGLCAPYWGPFVRFSRASVEMEDPDTEEQYELDVRSLNIGLAWGKRRFLFGDSFTLAWRMGYGVPVYQEMRWADGKPDYSEVIEVLVTVFGGIDGELSVGVAF